MYKRKELKKYNHLADHYKKRLINELDKLNIRLKAGLITQEDYEAHLAVLLKGRSVEDWLSYYDKYQDACVTKIREDETDIKIRAFFLILLLSILVFPLLFGFLFLI